MSRSPVISSARPPASASLLGKGAEQVVGLEVVARRHRPAEGARRSRGKRRTAARGRPASPPRALRGRPGRARCGRRRRRGRSRATTARGLWISISRRIRLAVPSSALTGLPSGPDDRVGQRVKGAKEHRGRIDGKQRLGHPRSLRLDGPTRSDASHGRRRPVVGYGLGDGDVTGATDRARRPGASSAWSTLGIARAAGHRHARRAAARSSPRSAATAASSGAGSGLPGR